MKLKDVRPPMVLNENLVAAHFCSCIAKNNRNEIINLRVLEMKNYKLRGILLHYNGK